MAIDDLAKGITAMGFVYQKLVKNHQRLGRTGFSIRVLAIQMVRLYLYYSRKFIVQRKTKKVTWAKLWILVRKAVGLARARERKPSYDSASYARNFDDGVWKEDEGFWRGGSFAYRYEHSVRLVG